MKILLLIAATTGTFFSSNNLANEHGNLTILLERIQAMEERIQILESRTSFATFMPDFSERFHVMHRAAESGDWAVASHELMEMKSMVASSTTIDPEKGKLFQAMMGPVIKDMADAIAHSNKEKMFTLLENAVQVCNGCHAATGSPFINVTLDADGALSMRHPHIFQEREMGSHGH